MTAEVGQPLQTTQPNGTPIVVDATVVGEEWFTIDADHPLRGRS